MQRRPGVAIGRRDDPREDTSLEAVGQGALLRHELMEVGRIDVCSVIEGWSTTTKISAVAVNVVAGQCEVDTSRWWGMVSGIAERLSGRG